MPENTDIVIVGGGPAGLSAAEAAAHKGARVIVLERQNEIGYPVHTSRGKLDTGYAGAWYPHTPVSPDSHGLIYLS